MEPLMTSDEIAAFLRVDVVTIRRLVSRGELTAYRVGGEYRFTKADLDDYLQRQRTSGEEGSSDRPTNEPLLQQRSFRKFARDRFDRFNDQARRVLTLAQEEAQRFQHGFLGTEHLLLGLLGESESIASQVLNNLGIDLGAIRREVEFIIGRGDHIVRGEIGLTRRAKKVIELAVEEAQRLKHHYVGTEHLLLGLIREGEGIAAGVLGKMGADLAKAREETVRVLDEAQKGFQPIPPQAATLLVEGEEGHTCSRCGARYPDYFRHCFNCGLRSEG